MAGVRNPHVTVGTFRFLRAVRLASRHPRYVFQQTPKREIIAWWAVNRSKRYVRYRTDTGGEWRNFAGRTAAGREHG